jgi:predicted DNA-binding transcriptional regulator YafY
VARSTRLLALLQALRGRRYPVTAAALAHELAVSERTIYRDLSELTAQGAPINGEAGVGYVLGPGLFLPPLALTEEETEALLLGLRYVDQRGDEVLTNAARSVRAKISSILSRELQTTVNAPLSAPGPGGAEFPDNAVSLAVLRSAIRTRTRINIHYADEQVRLTERVIWPIQLGFMDKARVVTAWCELRTAFRFFRTDRIREATLLDRYPARRADLLRDFHRDLRDAPRRRVAPDRI